MSGNNKKWESYEEVATFLLNQMVEEFNLKEFQEKQKVKGKKSGTWYEIDAKGVSEKGDIFLIVECRRYTKSKQSQENIAALAYRILDTGAEGGIIVSPLGVQSGARKIASAEKIYNVILYPNSTRSEYVLQFLNKIRMGFEDKIPLSDSITINHKKSNLL